MGKGQVIILLITTISNSKSFKNEIKNDSGLKLHDKSLLLDVCVHVRDKYVKICESFKYEDA